MPDRSGAAARNVRWLIDPEADAHDGLSCIRLRSFIQVLTSPEPEVLASPRLYSRHNGATSLGDSGAPLNAWPVLATRPPTPF